MDFFITKKNAAGLKYLYKSFLVIILALFLTDCTTQKRKGDMSALAKFYENTTAKYNGYFNARELLRASILELETQHEDNYRKVLDLYKYVGAENPQAVASNLDEAIKKVSIVVSLHRESVWTDDCYLLVGQAQYLKQDYEAAEETLRYTVDEFSPSKMAKKKRLSKKDKKVSKKKPSGNSKSNKKVSNKKTEEEKKSEDRAKSAAQRRKEYNRQVKKRKKKSSSSGKKKKSSSKKTTTSPRVLKPEAVPTDSKAEEREEEPLGEGLIRLSDKENGEANKKPKKYGIKHRPAYQESVLWLAKTLIERENYLGAERYMSQLERNPGTFKDVKQELAAVRAYYHLAQKDYDRAIKPLERAIKLADKKRDKARYAFIIAQVHQEAGRWDAAYAGYEKVLKHGPEYEMEFSSRLNLAQNSYLSGKGSAATAKKNLRKLLRDEKNEEYQDRIYFAMAEIDLKEGDREGAIENLTLSLSKSRSNRSQKAESYMTLGNLYMEEEEYVSAKNYYDSTLQVLANTDERYDQITKVRNSLTEIAESIQTIELQDSLLKISKLSDEEKRALAFELKKEADEAKRQKTLQKVGAGGDNPRTSTIPGRKLSPGGSGGALKKESSFFAYDDRALKRGVKDFGKKWGTRKLEDDWRRSNKRSTGDFDEEVVEEFVPEVFNEEDVKKYLRGIPETETEQKAAHLKIQEALFTLGTLYRERLENYPKSVEALEELERRYPTSTHELDAWYYLYLDHKDLSNPTKMKEYYDKITKKYSSSTYAMILKDPNYASKLMNKEQQLNAYYDNAYQAFTTGKYKVAFDKSVAAKTEFGAKNSLQPKFALLAAMSTGNLQGKDAYINALKDVVAKYPDTPEQTRAREILRLLGGGSAFLPGKEKAEESIYKVESDKLHYIIIAFNKDVSLTDNKAKVSDYNRKYHKLDKLRISNIYLGAETRTPIIVIRRFKDQVAAMKYFKGTQINKKDFIDKKNDFEIFAITQNNYRLVLKNKTINGYREFFEANYKR